MVFVVFRIAVAGFACAACSFQLTGGGAAVDASDGSSDGGADARDASTDLDAMTDASFDGPPDAFVPGRRKVITIDPARVTGTHPEFPVWLVLDDAQLAARAAANGSDIHFTLPGGTALAYEIQRWDKATGHLEAWVRMQVLDAAPTVFELHYGDVAMTSAPNPLMVFSSSFAAVWHLESATAIPDARGVRNGTPVNLAAGNSVVAQLGRGVSFTGNSAEITFTNPVTGTGPHTISLWVNQTATSDNDALVVLGNSACGQSRWLHGRFDTATIAVGLYCGPNDWANPGVNIIGTGSTLLHWVFEGSNNVSRLYRNGLQVAGPFTHGGTNSTTGTGGHLGNAPGAWGTNMGMHGTMDEVRIATTARAPGWVATEFANQSSPTTFYAVGPETP